MTEDHDDGCDAFNGRDELDLPSEPFTQSALKLSTGKVRVSNVCFCLVVIFFVLITIMQEIHGLCYSTKLGFFIGVVDSGKISFSDFYLLFVLMYPERY